MSKSIDTSKISKYRDVLLGIATVMVFWVHLPAIIFKTYTLPIFLLTGGRWMVTSGVDIFLFLSGMGLYYSMLKKPDVREFYRKRAERVLPALLIVLIAEAIVFENSFGETVKRITLLGFWIDGSRYKWYFALLIPLYILFPLLFKAVKSGKLKFPAAIGASLAVNLILHICAPEFYDHTIIALSRIPDFLCGVYFSHRMFTQKKSMEISRSWLYICLTVALLCVAYIMVLDSSFMQNRLYYICKYILNYRGISRNYIRPLFMVCLLVLFSCLKLNDGFFRRAAAGISKYSMEVYLLQEELQFIIDPLLSSTPAHMHTFLFDIISLALTAAAALLLKKLSGAALRAVKNNKRKTYASAQ